MNFNQVKKLIDHLFTLWISHPTESLKPTTTISFYGGEPLLNMAFIKNIINYIQNFDLKRDIRYTMTTNAVLLDQHIDFLVDNDFHLLVSLDGDKDANSYRIDKKGKSSFERVFKNLHSLKKKHPSFFSMNVDFNSVFHDRNSIEKTVAFIKKQFGKIPQISGLSEQGVAPEQKNIFAKMYQNVPQKIYESKTYNRLSQILFTNDPLVAQLLWFLQHFSGNIFFTYNDLLSNPQNDKKIPTGTCIPFAKKMFVSVNGKILPCEKIDHRYYYGHVSHDTLILDPDEIAIKFNNILDKIHKQCYSCFGNKTCTRCIYTLSSHNKKILCPYKESKISAEQQTAFYLKYLADHPTLYRRLLNEVAINY